MQREEEFKRKIHQQAAKLINLILESVDTFVIQHRRPAFNYSRIEYNNVLKMQHIAEDARHLLQRDPAVALVNLIKKMHENLFILKKIGIKDSAISEVILQFVSEDKKQFDSLKQKAAIEPGLHRWVSPAELFEDFWELHFKHFCEVLKVDPSQLSEMTNLRK